MAAERIVGGKWGACYGQACIGIDYLLVEEKYAPTLVSFCCFFHFFFNATSIFRSKLSEPLIRMPKIITLTSILIAQNLNPKTPIRVLNPLPPRLRVLFFVTRPKTGSHILVCFVFKVLTQWWVPEVWYHLPVFVMVTWSSNGIMEQR